MSSGSRTMDCPICFERFSSSVIGIHASSCTGAPPKTPQSAKKRPVSPARHDKEEEVAAKEEEPAAKKAKAAAGLTSPLADACRPTRLEHLMGQEEVTADTCFLKPLLTSPRVDRLPSLILWGPPGCGKTSLANVIAGRCKARTKNLV